MTDLETAKATLLQDNYTCVICKGEDIYTSQMRGVKPLVDWLDGKTDFSGFSAADKVIGKGAAFLYVLLKVKAVYARVISSPALEVLRRHNIYIEYDLETEHIINRKGDGFCPFEAAVLDTQDAASAYAAIQQKMKEMNI